MFFLASSSTRFFSSGTVDGVPFLTIYPECPCIKPVNNQLVSSEKTQVASDDSSDIYIRVTEAGINYYLKELAEHKSNLLKERGQKTFSSSFELLTNQSMNY